MPDRRMPEVGMTGSRDCRHRWRRCRQNTPNDRSREFLRNLPDRLTYRNAPAAGTRHEFGGVVPATIDKAVDVLEVTGRTIVPVTLRHRASVGTQHPTVRRFGRLAGRDKFLPSLWDWQDDERP